MSSPYKDVNLIVTAAEMPDLNAMLDASGIEGCVNVFGRPLWPDDAALVYLPDGTVDLANSPPPDALRSVWVVAQRRHCAASRKHRGDTSMSAPKTRAAKPPAKQAKPGDADKLREKLPPDVARRLPRARAVAVLAALELTRGEPWQAALVRRGLKGV